MHYQRMKKFFMPNGKMKMTTLATHVTYTHVAGIRSCAADLTNEVKLKTFEYHHIAVRSERNHTALLLHLLLPGHHDLLLLEPSGQHPVSLPCS